LQRQRLACTAQARSIRYFIQHFSIGDNRVLNDFGESLIEFAPGQRS